MFNRSDRVWVYGYVRMAPVVLLFGGLALLLILKAVPPAPAGRGRHLAPVRLLDRAVRARPVADAEPGQLPLAVGRDPGGPAGRPAAGLPAGKVVGIELAPREGEDYDDRQPARGGMDVTIRFRRAWPASLLVSPQDARHLADWARRHGKPVVERQP